MVGSVFQPNKPSFWFLVQSIYNCSTVGRILALYEFIWHAMPNAWTGTYSELVKQHLMYTINIVYTRRSWEMRGRSQTIVPQTLSSYAYGLLIVHLDLVRWSLACVAMLYKGMLVNQTLIHVSIIDLS